MITFAEKVRQVIRQIPRGRTLSYKEVAVRAGYPGAYRAVGNILNKNRDFKNIPCHRVIRSNGKIGGYVFGSKRKALLLNKEKAR